MIFLRQSTASQEVPLGRFVDSTDGNTEKTALTIANTDIKIWKTGATTLASKNSGGATHIANGEYYAVFDATDTDTIGPMKIGIHVAGALYVQVWATVLDEAVYDALFGTTALSTYAGADTSGTTTLLSRIGGAITITSGRVNADVTHWNTGAVSSAATGIPKVDVDTIKTNPVVNGGTITFPTTATLASTTNITAATGIVLSGVTHTGAVIPTVTTLTGHTAQTGDTYALANGANGFVATKADTAAIKTKTDYLPSATAGAAGGVFIAGTNAATTITTALTTTFTGSLTGNVNGNVGGNVTGSVGSLASVANIYTTAMTESYSSLAGTKTLAQALYEIAQWTQNRSVASTTETIKKVDGSTTAYTLTLDSATTPTSTVRAT